MPEFKTRAKFKCDAVNDSGEDKQWSFSAVYHNDNPDHENSKFCKFTPSGQFSMSVSNEHYKGEHPVPGKEYYLDISEAPETA